MKSIVKTAILLGACVAWTPVAAQDAGEPGVVSDVPEETVYDGDYLSVGIGVGYGPSYSGSDDYVAFPLPIVQGSLGGIGINPRPAGLALDFIPDSDSGPSLSLGVVGKLNRNRATKIEDPIVEAYGELDTAIEVGPTAGISFPGVLNPYDSVSLTVDAVWDVAGAHDGMSVTPTVTYFTPLSRGIAVSLSASTNWIDDDYADYYYSVPALNTLLPAADVLPGYQAEGGFESVGVNTVVGVDLNGDLTDGGLALIGIAGYSRLLGDAKDTPFTRLRGDADQWIVGAGIGYTF